MHQALAVARNEIRVLLRDRGQLVVLFLMPLMFATVIGSAFGGSPGISILLVNEDDGAYGAQIVETLQGIDALRIDDTRSADEADRVVGDGEALAAIVIPAGFSEQVNAHEHATVRVVVDPAQQQYGGIVTGIARDVVAPVVLRGEVQHGIRAVMDASPAAAGLDPAARAALQGAVTDAALARLQEIAENPLISVTVEEVEGIPSRSPQSAYAYSFPSYAVMFAFFIVGTLSGAILTERDQGTLRRLLASPLTRWAIIAGKMLAYVVVVTVQVLAVLAVGMLVFDVPAGRAPLGLLLLTVALGLSATGLGMLVAALARTPRQADAISVVLAIGLAALGGSVATIPPEGFLHTVSRFTPHAHAIQGYLQLTSFGEALADVWPQIGALAGLGVVFSAVAAWRLRFQ